MARSNRRFAPNNNLDTTTANALRAFGASYHFDPSYRGTDDGTTSTWTDRIGGEVLTSESQATRLVYSAAVSGFNNRPGWVATSANTTRLLGGSGIAAALAGTAAHTIYIVRKSSTTYTKITASLGKTSGTDYIYFGNLASGTSAMVRYVGTQTSHQGAVQNLDQPVVEAFVFTGTTGAIYSNGGTAVAAASDTKSVDIDRFCVGTLYQNNTHILAFDGVIGDIVIFLGAHTDAQRMYVERVLAAKYGWPVIQGLSGFSAVNYLANASTTSGIRGSASTGVWSDCLIRADVLPSLNPANIHGAFSGNTGQGVQMAVAGTTQLAYNGITGAIAPSYTITAADVGKLQLLGLSAGPDNLVHAYRQGAEVGAGTALTGYAGNSGIGYSIGARAGANPASQFSIFGVSGGDLQQVAANAAARAAAIKAAGKFVTSGGITPTHGWALDSVASSYTDMVGADAMTLTGTLTATQAIICTWPW